MIFFLYAFVCNFSHDLVKSITYEIQLIILNASLTETNVGQVRDANIFLSIMALQK